MDIDLRLRLINQASRGFAAFEQQVRTVQQRQRDEARRTAQVEIDEARRTSQAQIQAANQSSSASISAYQRVQSARQSLGIRSETAVRREISLTEAAYNRLARSGVASANELARAQQASIDRVRTLRNEMGELTRMQRAGMFAQTATAVAVGGYVAKSVLANPIRSAADLEEAQSALKIAMMKKDGSIPKTYSTVMTQAVDLGNRLSGSTKDFAMAATALKEQGMPDSALINGGLAASAYFGVLSGMDQYQSATTIAKMREAHGLRDDELPAMSNLMQKAHNAYGIASSDYLGVARYAAPTYNILGLTGKENARELLAVQGMAASVSLDSTEFGTNFAQMLNRTAQVDTRVNGTGKEAREVRAMLDEFGIQMHFFTKQGKFAGMENMFAQLDKLKPLNPQEQLRVLTKIFGVEAAKPAAIMVMKGGVKGFRESLAKLDAQPDMQYRIEEKTSTLKSKQEAAAGTWENTKAAAAKDLAHITGSIADMTNKALTAVQPTLEKHPAIGTTAITGLGAAGAGYAAMKYLKVSNQLLSVTGTALPGAGAISSLSAQVARLPALSSSIAASSMARLSALSAAVPAISRSAVLRGGVAPIVGGLAGNAVVDSVTQSGSFGNRYGKAWVNGASVGAGIGFASPMPGGTAIGGLIGGAVGLLVQKVSEAIKPPKYEPIDIKPLDVKTNVNVTLSPGLVIQNQSTQTTGGQVSPVRPTGNVWSGAPR